MLLDELRVKKDTIVALGHEFGAKHIRVFGSVARYEERPDSDIDFWWNSLGVMTSSVSDYHWPSNLVSY